MNKEAFLKVVNKVKEISEDDLENLLESSKFYPYCQNIHILIAKKYHDLQHGLAPAKLHKAAIYSPDRLFLKRIMEDDPTIKKFTRPSPAVDEIEQVQEFQIIDVPDAPEEISPAETQVTTTEIENLETSIESEKIEAAEESQISKYKEEIDADFPVNESTQPSTVSFTNDSNSIENEDVIRKEDIHSELERNIKEYKERRQQEAQAKESAETETLNETKLSDSSSSSESSLTNEDVKITEVPNIKEPTQISVKEESEQEDLTNLSENEKEVVTSAETSVDQRQLIENFIKLNPSLSRFDLKFDEDQKQLEDLSIPKLTIGEHLISENLAVILHKQGKVQKAVNIYEKLILKFPEKKAYFASCIEKIKNPL